MKLIALYFLLSLQVLVPQVKGQDEDDMSSSSKKGGAGKGGRKKTLVVDPLPIYVNGTEISYGNFTGLHGEEKEATYSNLLSEYADIAYAAEGDAELLYTLGGHTDDYHFAYMFSEKDELDDTTLYVDEGKSIFFRLGTIRGWTYTVLNNTALANEYWETCNVCRVFDYFLGAHWFDFVKELHAQGDIETLGAISDTELNVLGSELLMYHDVEVEAYINGIMIPEAETFLTKTMPSAPHPSRNSTHDAEILTGWYMLLPPLPPGRYEIDSRTFIGNFFLEDTSTSAGFTEEERRVLDICVGDPDIYCRGGKKGGSSGKKGEGKRRGLSKKDRNPLSRNLENSISRSFYRDGDMTIMFEGTYGDF